MGIISFKTYEDIIIIAGSDKRGTIYGIYDLSQQIGVSPWYWWADAPIKHQDCLYIKASRIVQPSPKVKCRRIFINDEWPSFGTWATRHFGDLNSKMYAHLFELLFRLKANYLWPAMWSSSFNEDDSISPILADEYGIVMGTSHHEPMMRAHKEYVSRKNSIGPWDYTKNKDNIDKFFSEGLERNHKFENIITIGMRGDGDVAMGNGDDKDNMETLKRVINSQRQIIRNTYNKNPQEVPQLWAIFTEVQRYLCVAMGIRPTQDVYLARGLRIGVRLDNGELHIIDARKGLVDSFNEYTPQNIKISHKLKALPEKSKLALSGYGLRQRMRNDVFDDIRWLDTAFNNVSKGIHTLQIIMIDPEVVFEELVINPDNNYPSYFSVHK